MSGDLSAAYLKLLARRLARQCRRTVQCCLLEEEWFDVDAAFQELILAGLQELDAQRSESMKQSGHVV